MRVAMTNLVQPPAATSQTIPHQPAHPHPAHPQPTFPWWRGWLPVIAFPCLVAFATPPTWPAWALMWTFALAIYGGCKWLTWRRTPTHGASPWKQAGYLLAWPGMDAVSFFDASRTVAAPRTAEWLFASGKFAAGLSLAFVVTSAAPAENSYWFGWLGVVAIAMLLHFGVFHLLSCTWRALGVNAQPLMNWPAASENLSEFWGRRWNMAFRDLTYRFLFRPLTARLGPRPALFVGFVVSGLIHDAVISFPARGGYGGPTIYFLIQALGLFVERSRVGRKLGLGAKGRGWIFTMIVLLAPVPLLFHKPFVDSVIIPFMQALGAV